MDNKNDKYKPEKLMVFYSYKSTGRKQDICRLRGTTQHQNVPDFVLRS